MDQRLPNLFILGAPKAGTTFLHNALGLVDDVYMSGVKEPGYFTSERDQRRGLGYYLDAYFSGASNHAVRGESTPWYLYSTEACERIAEIYAESPPRFLVLVRRPSDRAYSMYRDLQRANLESRTFEQAVSQELAAMGTASERSVDVYHRYVWCGRYVEHIERWQAVFGPDCVHVEVFDDLSERPDDVWHNIGRFLGTDLGPSRFDEVEARDRNPRGSLRWPWLDRLIRTFEGRDSAVLEKMKQVLPPGLHRRVLQGIVLMNRAPAGGPTDEADPVVRQLIDDACQESTQRLEKLIGQSLSTWAELPVERRQPPGS